MKQNKEICPKSHRWLNQNWYSFLLIPILDLFLLIHSDSGCLGKACVSLTEVLSSLSFPVFHRDIHSGGCCPFSDLRSFWTLNSALLPLCAWAVGCLAEMAGDVFMCDQGHGRIGCQPQAGTQTCLPPAERWCISPQCSKNGLECD